MNMGMAKPILLRRIRNDLSRLGANISVSDPGTDPSFPLTLSVHVSGITGYVSPGVTSSEHEFSLILGEDFPYERPRVRWVSPIFHPNIMSPEEGGLVCVMGIDRWDFDTGLDAFLRDLTDLINNPNPHDPLRSETCSAAAEWFSDKV